MAANLRLKLKKPGRIQTFDDSDLSEYNSSSDGSSLRAPAVKSQAVLPRSVPNHLLLISILEQLCIMYSDDSRQAQDIFKSLCGQLTDLNVVSPLLVMDEMSSLRTQYRHSVHRMLVAAIHKSKKGMFTSLLPLNGLGQGYLPALQNKIPSQPTMSPDDMVNQTSRYNAEFVEVEKLGKGGFGAVYKSRNKLDGKLYAVKKVKFKHAKPEVWFRVLREVKALASLQHYNIVGYNAAWLEYGSAIMSKSSSGDHFDNIPSLENNLSSSTNDTSVIFQDSSSSDDHITGDVVTFDKRVRWGSGPKIKELLNTDSSENDSSSPDRIAANPPRLLKMFNRNNSHHDIGSFKNVTEFFDTADFAALNTLESHSEFDSNFGSQSGVDGDYYEVVKIKHEKTEFTLDSAATSVSSQITDAHVTRDRRKNVRRSGIGRSISCDPLASGEIILQEEDTRDIHNFTEESFPLKKSVTLYIQMELCSHTLWEWMKTRNEMCQSEDEFMTYKDRNMAIFRQILKAVEYIHSQGVIHRDLKPRNIFLREKGLHIKVGDFGLATEDVFSPIYDEPITFSSSPTKLFRTGSTLSDHTSGVGTSTYAAPEQLIGSAYNTKCDIYSLGVILFELFQKYSTEMERYRSLEDLRKGIIPHTVYKNWPVEAHYIELMICDFPEKRPSAKEMLNGELFLSKDQVISDMKTRELTYKTEIERLKKLLSQRDKTIAERDKTIEELIEHGVSSPFVGTSV